MKACVNAVLLCFCNVCSLSQGGNFVPRIYCGPINAGDLLKGRPDSRRGGEGQRREGILCARHSFISLHQLRESGDRQIVTVERDSLALNTLFSGPIHTLREDRTARVDFPPFNCPPFSSKLSTMISVRLISH